MDEKQVGRRAMQKIKIFRDCIAIERNHSPKSISWFHASGVVCKPLDDAAIRRC